MIPRSAVSLSIQRSLEVPVENSPAVPVQFMYIYLHGFWTTFGYAGVQLILKVGVPDCFLKVQWSCWKKQIQGTVCLQCLKCDGHPAFSYPRVNDRPSRASLLPSKRPIENKKLFFQVGYHFLGKDRAFRQENKNDLLKSEKFSPTAHLALLRPEQNALACEWG